MKVDADLGVDLDVINERTDGPLFKASRDPRVTRVGAIVRALSIDELPQFFNVLNGTMSLVGPRPALPDEVAQFELRVAPSAQRQSRHHRTLADRSAGQSVVPYLSEARPRLRRQLVNRTRPLHHPGDRSNGDRARNEQWPPRAGTGTGAVGGFVGESTRIRRPARLPTGRLPRGPLPTGRLPTGLLSPTSPQRLVATSYASPRRRCAGEARPRRGPAGPWAQDSGLVAQEMTIVPQYRG